AGRELLVGNQRAGCQLKAEGGRRLPVIGESQRVLGIALENGEAGVRLVALVAELVFIAAVTEEAPGTGHQAQAQGEFGTLGETETAITESQRGVLERDLVALVAELHRLIEVLEVHSRGKRVRPVACR